MGSFVYIHMDLQGRGWHVCMQWVCNLNVHRCPCGDLRPTRGSTLTCSPHYFSGLCLSMTPELANCSWYGELLALDCPVSASRGLGLQVPNHACLAFT